MQTIYLDISNKGVVPVIYAKQGDVGRKVEVILTNSGLPYEPEAGSAFSAWFSGASGVGNYTDIGEKSAFSVSGNKVTVELITQMLQNAGEGFLCLVLSRANGDQIGLWNIRYICDGIPGAGSDPAKDYYTAFSQAVAGLAYPDASLTIPGKAADAAATGLSLKGKAPAGYGLGGDSTLTVTTLADLDLVTANGTYQFTNSAATLYGINCRWAILRVTNYDSAAVMQELFPTGSTTRLVRVRNANVWGEWEVDNPPMIPTEEYRTTERWNGKPVYAMLIDVGEMPSSSNKEFPHILGANVMVVDYTLMLYRDDYSFRDVKNTDVTIFRTIGTVFVINNIDSTESNRAYLAIKYVKN